MECGPLWLQLLWKVLLMVSNMMMLKKLCFRKVFILNPFCSLLRESSDLKGRINLPGAPMSPAFLYARGARQGSVEGPDMWNQVLDNALREPAGRWETEGSGHEACQRLPQSPMRGVAVHLVTL